MILFAVAVAAVVFGLVGPSFKLSRQSSWSIEGGRRNLLLLTIGLVLMGVWPFVDFIFWTGPRRNWSGLELDPTEFGSILRWHAPIAVSWFVVQMVQMATKLLGRSFNGIHKAVGYLGLYAILPMLLLNLLLQAVTAFLPSKPRMLAQAKLTARMTDDPSVPQMLFATLPLASGLVLLPQIMMAYVGALRSVTVQPRNWTLHVYFMFNLNTLVVGAGVVRWACALAFRLSGCRMHDNDLPQPSVMELDTVGFLMTGVYYLVVGGIYFIALPSKMRGGLPNALFCSLWISCAISFASASLLGVSTSVGGCLEG